MAKRRMNQKEYEDTVRYYIFRLIVFPIIVCVAISIVGGIIETSFDIQLGVAKTIFIGIGGIGYFILYFKRELSNK